MEISKQYDSSLIEKRWYETWIKNDFFSAKPNPKKKPFTIVIPPPNVTGVLHMGHMLNNTIQDIMIRRARMQGFEACWVPGTDHASIATEAKVVSLLKEQGIDKKSLTREQFLAHAFDWKEKYGGIILQQLRNLGASCDWNRTEFTMNPHMSEAVIDVFIKLHQKGLIYRGARMVNWDPQGKTAVSDEEVIYKEVNSKLYYIKYLIEGTNDFLTVATTRPETIMGDTAICVNPNDERYKKLVGKNVFVPIINRLIPIIEDEYVDAEFGTGCLKVTPAHDINDYNLGVKYKLESIDIFNENGTLNQHGQMYEGLDRFVARKRVAADLLAIELLAKTEDIKNKVGYSERTDAVIEPRISTQWFCKMSEMAKPALDHVMDGTIKLHPAKFNNMYKSWMENVHDWCISRQLWWGQQIPAWYDNKGNFVVAKTELEAKEKFAIQFPNSDGILKQDEDVLDTWFSSWLWPISVFKGIENPDNEDFKYFYPTNDLVTAPEILFFWVARMIMAGYEFTGMPPFKNVYLTGIVRDKQGRKMSKSLGNSPDPLELIEKYSADGVRSGMLFSSPAGNDLPFDEKLCEQGRNFCNKIWNALRLVKGWEVDSTLPMPIENAKIIEWFDSKLNSKLIELEDLYSKYKISDVLLTVYKLIWDDFCAWYLEGVKPTYQSPIDHQTLEKTVVFFEKLMQILHPIMPFITEEAWHVLKERNEKDCIIISEYPVAGKINEELLDQTEIAFQIISEIRNFRNSKGMSPKTQLLLHIENSSSTEYLQFVDQYQTIIKKMGNIEQILEQKNESSTFVIKSLNVLIPIENQANSEDEKERLEEELTYLTGFLNSVEVKLNNEKFVQNAKPEVIEIERKKKADSENKIINIKKTLETYK